SVPKDERGNCVNRFPKAALACSESILGAFAILYVRIDAVPLDDFSTFVTQRLCAKNEPPIGAIVTPEPCFGVTWGTRGENSIPGFNDLRLVVRMDRLRPPPPLERLPSQTYIIQIMSVYGLQVTVSARRPDQRRRRVDDELHLAFVG